MPNPPLHDSIRNVIRKWNPSDADLNRAGITRAQYEAAQQSDTPTETLGEMVSGDTTAGDWYGEMLEDGDDES